MGNFHFYGETVYEQHWCCVDCGRDFTAEIMEKYDIDYAEYKENHDAATEASKVAYSHVSSDDSDDCSMYCAKNISPIYETKWVEDTAAYDACTKCGKVYGTK